MGVPCCTSFSMSEDTAATPSSMEVTNSGTFASTANLQGRQCSVELHSLSRPVSTGTHELTQKRRILRPVSTGTQESTQKRRILRPVSTGTHELTHKRRILRPVSTGTHESTQKRRILRPVSTGTQESTQKHRILRHVSTGTHESTHKRRHSRNAVNLDVNSASYFWRVVNSASPTLCRVVTLTKVITD